MLVIAAPQAMAGIPIENFANKLRCSRKGNQRCCLADS